MGRPGPRWDAGDAPPEASPSAQDVRADVRVHSRREKPPRVQPEDATLRRRLGAWLIDELARTIFYPILLIVLVAFGGQVPAPASPGELSAAVVLPQIVLRVGLSWIFWSQGSSPGAMVLGVRLVDAHGNAPGPYRGAIRALVEILSISTMLIGFAWALFSRRRQTWHDLASGVYVVNAPREEGREGARGD